MALTDRPAASTTVEPRFPCFDGLRALAALAVLHDPRRRSPAAPTPPTCSASFFARMDGGVAVFFVLSGVLHLPPVRAVPHPRPSRTPATGPYLWRRALRIYPAYWLAMTVIVYVFGATQIPSLRSFVLDYSLLNIYSPHQPDVFGPLLQSWTLVDRAHLLRVRPALGARSLRRVARGDIREPHPGAARRRRRAHRRVGALEGASCSAPASTTAGSASSSSGCPWWLDLFAIGMALACAEPRGHAPRRPATRCGSTAAARRCSAGSARSARSGGSPRASGSATRRRTIAHHLLWGQHYLYGAVAVLLVLPAVFGPQDRELEPHPRVPPDPRDGVPRHDLVRHLPLARGVDRPLPALDGRAGRSPTYTSDIPFRWHTNSVISVPWFTFVLAVLVLTIASATHLLVRVRASDPAVQAPLRPLTRRGSGPGQARHLRVDRADEHTDGGAVDALPGAARAPTATFPIAADVRHEVLAATPR